MPFVKGQSGNPAGKPKGIKNRTTLIMEERRRIFEAKASEKWEKIIDALPPTYVADQFMGRAQEKIDITTGGEKITIDPKKVAEINRIALDDE